MCKIASWAVPVAIQAVLKQSTGGHTEFKMPSEPLPEKLTRWITASLVRGNLAVYKSKLGEEKSTAKSYISCLNSSDFHPTNIELASQLLRLQVHVAGEGSNLLVSALVMLWPLYEPNDTPPGLHFHHHFLRENSIVLVIQGVARSNLYIKSSLTFR